MCNFEHQLDAITTGLCLIDSPIWEDSFDLIAVPWGMLSSYVKYCFGFLLLTEVGIIIVIAMAFAFSIMLEPPKNRKTQVKIKLSCSSNS